MQNSTPHSSSPEDSITKTMKTVGVTVSSIVPFGRGGSHQALLAVSNEGSGMIVQIHSPVFECSVTLPYKMASEVATLQYLRSNTTLPVAKVYHHDLDLNGTVGAEWMAVEAIPGSQLEVVWPSLCLSQQESICIEVADLWALILKLKFPKIGSIHPSITSDDHKRSFHVGPMSRLPSRNIFTIGVLDITQCGPFPSSRSWLRALARQDLDYPSSRAPDPEQPEWTAECNDRLEAASIPEGPANAFVLEHIDFTPYNILVTPPETTDGMPKIAGVLDWEGARVVPMWATNCGWRWPESSSIEEQSHLTSLMQNRIGVQLPEWLIAMGDTYKDARKAYLWASSVTFDAPVLLPCIEEKNTCHFYAMY